MALSANFVGKPLKLGGCVALLRSETLEDWELLDPVYISDGLGYCECPDIFPLDGKYVLLISSGRTFVRLGESMRGPFRMPEGNSYFDDNRCYAVKTLLDDKNRRIAWGWIPEPWLHHEERPDFQEWSGALTLPRELKIDKEGHLCISLCEEVKNLRTEMLPVELSVYSGKWSKENNIITGKPAGDYAFSVLKGIKEDPIEIEVTLNLKTARKAGIIVKCTEDLSEMAGITFNKRTNELEISNMNNGFEDTKVVWNKPYLNFNSIELIKPENEVSLRIIVDGSIIEVYANNRTVLTGRCYAKDNCAFGMGLVSIGGITEFKDLKIWKLGL
jgi:beta-fructofuranosidase